MKLIVKLNPLCSKQNPERYCSMKQCPVNLQQIKGHKGRKELCVLCKEFSALSYKQLTEWNFLGSAYFLKSIEEVSKTKTNMISQFVIVINRWYTHALKIILNIRNYKIQSMFLHCYKETITKMTCVAFVLRLERS